MKDEQIIYTLRCCQDSLCMACPNKNCTDDIFQLALDLINRQKAEINNLKAELSAMRSMVNSLKMHMENEKKDVIKEFARELKCGVPQETGVIRCKDIDNLVKEMTEANNDRQS